MLVLLVASAHARPQCTWEAVPWSRYAEVRAGDTPVARVFGVDGIRFDGAFVGTRLRGRVYGRGIELVGELGSPIGVATLSTILPAGGGAVLPGGGLDTSRPGRFALPEVPWAVEVRPAQKPVVSQVAP